MKKPQRQTLTAPIRRVRFVYVAMFLCAWVGVIAVRLAWLQIVRHDEFADLAGLALTFGGVESMQFEGSES